MIQRILPIEQKKQTNKQMNVFIREFDQPYEMLRLIFLFVASLVNTSLRIDIVEILSDLKMASPFLKRIEKKRQDVRLSFKGAHKAISLLRYHRHTNLSHP